MIGAMQEARPSLPNRVEVAEASWRAWRGGRRMTPTAWFDYLAGASTPVTSSTCHCGVAPCSAKELVAIWESMRPVSRVAVASDPESENP